MLFETEEAVKATRATRISILERESKSSSNGKALYQNCDKAMIPHIITYKDVPELYVCPFCGCVHREFVGGFPIIVELIKAICVALLVVLVLSFLAIFKILSSVGVLFGVLAFVVWCIYKSVRGFFPSSQ